MKDADSIISGIETKLKNIIEIHQQTKEEKLELSKKISELQSIVDTQRDAINQLEEEQKKLKISRSLENNKGSLDARLKINELVREIDKCIALLNK